MNNYFRFKEFTVVQDRAAMKVCTDSCLFGAWSAEKIRGKNVHVLDIGSGTGLLSLMLAQQTEGDIEALEIEKGAYDDTRYNFEQSVWSSRLQAHNAAMQDFFPASLFDVIICNPPFFDADLKSPDPNRNMAMHGTDLTLEQVFDFAYRNTRDTGKLLLLVSARRKDDVRQLAAKQNWLIANEVMVSQTPDHPAFRMMYCLTKKMGSATLFDEILIRDKSGNYSQKFAGLLKSYYLKL